MKALIWLLGVMVVLLGLSDRRVDSSAWTAVWIGAAVLWFFVGVVLGIVGGAKLMHDKIGAGLNAASLRARREVPAPHKEE